MKTAGVVGGGYDVAGGCVSDGSTVGAVVLLGTAVGAKVLVGGAVGGVVGGRGVVLAVSVGTGVSVGASVDVGGKVIVGCGSVAVAATGVRVDSWIGVTVEVTSEGGLASVGLEAGSVRPIAVGVADADESAGEVVWPIGPAGPSTDPEGGVLNASNTKPEA